MKMYDLVCRGCGEKDEMLLDAHELEMVRCKECGSDMDILPNFAGYSVKGNNSASVRPRSAGAFKGRKNVGK